MIRTLLVVLVLAVAAASTWAAEAEESLEDNLCVACHGNSDVWEEDTKHLFVTADDLRHDIHWQKGIRCQECHGGNAESFNLREAHALEDGFREIKTPSDLPGFCGHCHSDMEYMRRFQPDAQTDPVAEFWKGAHGMHLRQTPGEGATSCISCHPKHAMRAQEDPESAVHPTHLSETCGVCHQDQLTALLDDVHGSGVARGDADADLPLDCNKCHGQDVHAMLPVGDPASPVFTNNQVENCGSCHKEGLQSYLDSVHGHGLRASGLLVTAVCSSCHRAHGIFSAEDERSTLHVTEVASTCAKCHRFIEERLRKSVHGQENGPGGATEKAAPGGEVKRKPSCTDCHEGHDRPHPDSVRFRLQLSHSCGNCHHELSQGYALSLHGQLTDLGYGPAAKCSDCHGSHDVLSINDPNCRLALENRIQTCRSCHPNAVRNFCNFLPHANHKDGARNPVLHAVFLGMEMLLYSVFGFFGVHTLLWMIRSLMHVSRYGRPQRLRDQQYAYLRFQSIHRLLHLIVIVSFLGLALTGLPLRYSDQLWARRLATALGGFDSTSVWHHVFGAVTVCYFVAHLIWLARRMIQRRLENATWKKILFGPDSTVPNLQDIKDLFGMLRWFIGLGPKPVFERWTYWEKFDYWAVFWGVAIIGTSGFMLWMPNLFSRFLPGEALNVAKIIHSEEALLATGFIFAIHFCNTIRPEKFPMDLSMLTGLVNEEEFREERPAYYQRLRDEGKLDQLRTVVPPRRALALVMLAGFTAISIGTALLIGMIAAALSA